MCPVGEADVTKDEPAQEKISRLQKTLGGAFNGVWVAWVRRAAVRQGTVETVKNDPKLNSAQLCSAFLQAWGNAAYDAYKMDRDLGLRVDWPT
eukprot:2268053-Pyramimonas_sp.AAC.1